MIIKYIFVFQLFFKYNSSIDPVEGIVRNFLLHVKSAGEKVLANIAIPSSSDVMFQMDEKNSYALGSLTNFLNTCPPYMPNDFINGSWSITYLNRRLLQTTFGDVDEAIDDLASGQGMNTRRTLKSLLRDSITMSCGNITVATDTTVSNFELAYISSKGPKSIIGSVWKAPDKSLQFSFAPNLVFRGIISYRSYTSSEAEVIVLSDLDTYPKCDNYLVLQRFRNNTDEKRLLEMLTSTGANFPSNPLLSIDCL